MHGASWTAGVLLTVSLPLGTKTAQRAGIQFLCIHQGDIPASFAGHRTGDSS